MTKNMLVLAIVYGFLAVTIWMNIP